MPAPSSFQRIMAYLQGGATGVETLLSGPTGGMQGLTSAVQESTPDYYSVLKEYEGLRTKQYKDHKGYPTIGIGHKILDGENFSGYGEKEFKDLFVKKDLPAHLDKTKRLINNFDEYPKKLKEEMVASVFRGGLSGSPNTIKLINSGKYKEASVEFLNNDEYRKEKAKGNNNSVVRRMENLAAELKKLGEK